MVPATEKAVFDREGLLERLGGDTELLDEVLGIFLDECREMLASIRAATALASSRGRRWPYPTISPFCTGEP